MEVPALSIANSIAQGKYIAEQIAAGYAGASFRNLRWKHIRGESTIGQAKTKRIPYDIIRILLT
jgi:hypothetical protein